jgi:hypothetical protein
MHCTVTERAPHWLTISESQVTMQRFGNLVGTAEYGSTRSWSNALVSVLANWHVASVSMGRAGAKLRRVPCFITIYTTFFGRNYKIYYFFSRYITFDMAQRTIANNWFDTDKNLRPHPHLITYR